MTYDTTRNDEKQVLEQRLETMCEVVAELHQRGMDVLTAKADWTPGFKRVGIHVYSECRFALKEMADEYGLVPEIEPLRTGSKHVEVRVTYKGIDVFTLVDIGQEVIFYAE